MHNEEREEERRSFDRPRRDLWQPDGTSAPPETAPINPPLRHGQRVVCAQCGRMSPDALALVGPPAFRFICPACRLAEVAP
jgi:hypothetical protein